MSIAEPPAKLNPRPANTSGRRLRSNTLALLSGNVGSAVLSFGLSVLIGRATGAEGLGVYSAVLAWVFPLLLVSEFGINTLLTREIAQHPEFARAYAKQACLIFAALSFPLMLVVWLFAPLMAQSAAAAAGLRLSAPLLLVAPCFGALTATLRARQVMWPIPLLNVGMLFSQVVLTLLVFLAGGDVLAALAVNVSTSAGQLVAAWVFWLRLIPASDVQSIETDIRSLLKRAWPFALAGVLAALQSRFGLMLLERLGTAQDAGYYAAASRFTEAAKTIPYAFFGAVFPALAAFAAQPIKVRRLMEQMLFGLLLYSLVAALVLSLLALPLIMITYSWAFIASAGALQLLAWSLVPALLRAGITLYWYAHQREGLANRVNGAVLLLQVPLCLWLIPRQGAAGLAIASLTIETIALVLLGWPLLHHLWKPYGQAA
ncbi:MAG: oligosaccharide flippase family protein [bacterium]|nr:oligosaccharide flippase family protein [bacterium]